MGGPVRRYIVIDGWRDIRNSPAQSALGDFAVKTEWQVLAFKEGDLWVAQCLTYDIAAQADSFDSLVDAFISTARRYAELDIQHGKRPFQDRGPAPYMEKLQALYDEHRYRVPVTFEIPSSESGVEAEPAEFAIAA